MTGAVIGMVLVMVIPLPPRMIDLLLACNITLSFVTILVALYTSEPLELSIFPSLLLVLTLFRLALNVSTTRLILLYGNQGPEAAGDMIRSFGSFVVGENFVVSIVVFSILILINFVVITKGAGRIAEVGSHFMLDVMPRKQMAVDADLSTALINEEEARKRRQAIQQEADFYETMDDASRCISGDAIVGIFITLVNVVGGIVIGLIQQGLQVQPALKSYTILTIGDGLVSHIPALIISTAAGIVVTKVAKGVNLGAQITSKFLTRPSVLGTASAVEACETEVVHAAPELIDTLAPIDLLELEVGYSLIPLVEVEREGELLGRVKAMRRQVAQELEIVVPPLRIRDGLQLKPTEYAILIKGIEIARGELMIGHVLAMYPGRKLQECLGISTTEPAFGLSAAWIKEEDKEQAQLAGCTVVDLVTVIVTHLSEVIKQHLHKLVSREEVQKRLDSLAQEYSAV